MSREVDFARLDPRVVLGAALASVLALSALLARVGADAGWLAALGHVIAARGSVPAGVPFASAATAHWPNALVLAELIFAGLESAFGDRGLMLAQLACVAAGLVILAHDARAGAAAPAGIAAALVVAGIGALPSLAIARVQMFSLVLFPLLVSLLRAETRSPSRRVWLAVPLLALWSNLHGAALLGAGTVLVYLAVQRGRRRPIESLCVAVACLAALCLTPAGLRTVTYYSGLMTNVAVQRGEGMWGSLSVTSPLDMLMVLAGLALAYRAWRARMPIWEWVLTLVLAALTVKADRDGVWLLFLLSVPAARSRVPIRAINAVAPIALIVAGAALTLSLVRGPVPTGASRSLLTGAIAAAHGSPVLADSSIDEQVALAGGRIWAGNPIDAFSRRVQGDYLDWVAGDRAGERALASGVRVVIVSRGSQTQALMARTPGFVAAQTSPSAIVYERQDP